VRLCYFIALIVSGMALAPVDSFAHGDVHDSILRVTAEISQNPSNATLYFQRSELYRVDGDYTNALADLNRAAKVDPSIARVDFCRGRIQFDSGHLPEALALLNKYLAKKPEDTEAFSTRARVYRKLNEFKKAADDYTTAISMMHVPNPELYIERAEVLKALGKGEDALRGLDEGIRLLGPLVTFQLPAIDLEVFLKRYDAALTRIDTASARMQRKETWLMRRADVLKQAGRMEEAQKNYGDALAAIDRLPPTHRNTRATLDLEQRIRDGLASVTPPPPRK